MTAEEAIERSRAAHKAQGCVCDAPVVALVRLDKVPERRGEPDADRNFSVSVEHQDWCPLFRSMLERGPARR